MKPGTWDLELGTWNMQLQVISERDEKEYTLQKFTELTEFHTNLKREHHRLLLKYRNELDELKKFSPTTPAEEEVRSGGLRLSAAGLATPEDIDFEMSNATAASSSPLPTVASGRPKMSPSGWGGSGVGGGPQTPNSAQRITGNVVQGATPSPHSFESTD